MRKMQCIIAVCIACVFICCDVLAAVDQKAPVHANDLLSIKLTGLQGAGVKMDFKKRVDQDGKISLPLVGKVDVKDQKLSEVQDAVDTAYKNANLVRNTAATITREELGEKASVKSGPIAKGDHIEFRIWDVVGPGVETKQILVVDDKGEVSVPVAGALKLVDLNEADAEKAVVKLYLDKNLIANAMVLIRRISAEEANGAPEK